MSPLSDKTMSPLAAFSPEKFATTLRADFRFAPLNVMILIGVFLIGMIFFI